MKKQEINAIIATVKYGRTAKLQDMMHALDNLEGERDLTKRMYFWSGFGNSSERANFARRYSADITIKITNDFTVRYQRSVEPSRSYAYASDTLWAIRDGEKISLTLTDTKKMSQALKDIIDRRISRSVA